MSRTFHSLLLVLTALVLLSGSPVRATILTFDIDNFPAGTSAGTATLQSTHAAYGDNVSSLSTTGGGFTYNYGMGNGFTPNVVVDYTLGTNAANQLYYTDGGNPPSPLWTNVNFLHGGGNPFTHYITFTPSGGNGVRVNSFDLFGYASALTHTYNWNLRANTTVGTILASGGPTAFTGAVASPSTVTTGAGPYYGGPLVLEIVHTAGTGGAWGMDNLNFDEFTPPALTATPVDSTTIDLSGTETLVNTQTNAITIQNTGGIGSPLDITGFTLSGPDAALFDVPDFVITTLIGGGIDTVQFDLAFLAPVHSDDLYQATLTFQTSLGDLTYNLEAFSLPVPEPSSCLLLTLGLGLAWQARRRTAVRKGA